MVFKYIKFRIVILSWVFFLLLASMCCDTGLSQQDYEQYIAQGYTEEEMIKLNQYSTIIGLADVCGLDSENEFHSIIAWLEKKEEEGLPGLYIYFLDNVSNTTLDAMESPANVSCEEVRRNLHNVKP